MSDSIEDVGGLSEQQVKAIDALMRGSSEKDAAEQAGVDPRTLFRWRQKPVFAAELKRRKRAALEQATSVVATRMVRVVKRLVKEMEEAPSDRVRVQAASSFLKYGLALLDAFDVREELEQLKAMQDNLNARVSGNGHRPANPRDE